MNPITVDKQSEFFICITKGGIHSSIRLGVMVGQQPKFLACVGKTNLIDKDFGLTVRSQLRMFKKNVLTHTEAFLNDDGISNLDNEDISYQSYTITYDQYREFLSLIKFIHDEQKNHYKKRIDALPEGTDYRGLSYPQKGVYKLRGGISCYIPFEEEGGAIRFEYSNLEQYNNPIKPLPKSIDPKLIDDTKKLSMSNTCRTTARAILNYTLGYSPKTPALFAIDFNYKTTIKAHNSGTDFFYVLPPPPVSYPVDSTQKKTLEALYRRLENIPKNEPNSQMTKEKFDAIKELYKKIAGTPQLSIMELLDAITIHRMEHNDLFKKHRGKSLVTRFAEAIGLKTGTQKAYDEMEKAVHQEIKRLRKEPVHQAKQDVSPKPS